MAVTSGELEDPSWNVCFWPNGFDTEICMYLFVPAAQAMQPFWKAGRRAVAYDVIYDDVFMDFNSARGYSHALYQVLRLEPGSGLTLAPVCSSWVFMWFGILS